MTDEIAIRAESLSKRYRLGVAGSANDSLREIMVRGARTIVGLEKRRPSPPRKEFFALKDASFEIKRGENVGIIGPNGAGKSTLLKILSRITEPTSGRALIAGRVGALLEVGTGFHQELTGRENIFLYGAILGMGQKEILAKFDTIVDFAEIAEFIDTPVKRYSSGMYVRLAFAVAAHLRPDILLLDEVLAVGDMAFQRKCMAFARELQKQDATILFVSHNMFSIKTMCSRVIYVEQGQIKFDGATDMGIEFYERGAQMSTLPWWPSDTSGQAIVLSSIELTGINGERKFMFDHGERMKVRLRLNVREPIDSPNIMVAYVRSDGVSANVFSTETDSFETGLIEGDTTIELTTPPLKLVAERYVINVVVRRKHTHTLYTAQVGCAFHVRDPQLDTLTYGMFHEGADWSMAKPQAGEASSALTHAAS